MQYAANTSTKLHLHPHIIELFHCIIRLYVLFPHLPASGYKQDDNVLSYVFELASYIFCFSPR